MNLCDIHTMKELLGRHGFHFSKSMGQNFLVADWVPARIAQEAELDRDCGVLEIGPGIGSLTVQLSGLAGKVVAVELDRSLLPILSETLEGQPNVSIISGDVMKLDLNALLDEYLPGLRLVSCANLPYNITTPVLTKLLELKRFSSITVMIQREVARRICASPGTADYGAFSLFCQYHAHCQILFDVSPACFLPSPKVTSSVLRMIPLNHPPVEVSDEKWFFSIVRAAFAQRRKTLLNSLSSAFGNQISKDTLRQTILNCGLPEHVRGERLSLDQFVELAEQLR